MQYKLIEKYKEKLTTAVMLHKIPGILNFQLQSQNFCAVCKSCANIAKDAMGQKVFAVNGYEPVYPRNPLVTYFSA
jgi:hypothetical protein